MAKYEENTNSDVEKISKYTTNINPQIIRKEIYPDCNNVDYSLCYLKNYLNMKAPSGDAVFQVLDSELRGAASSNFILWQMFKNPGGHIVIMKRNGNHNDKQFDDLISSGLFGGKEIKVFKFIDFNIQADELRRYIKEALRILAFNKIEPFSVMDIIKALSDQHVIVANNVDLYGRILHILSDCVNEKVLEFHEESTDFTIAKWKFNFDIRDGRSRARWERTWVELYAGRALSDF